jgi:hypothetical protein
MANRVFQRVSRPAAQNVTSATMMLRHHAEDVGLHQWPFFPSPRYTYSVKAGGLSSAEFHCAYAAAYRRTLVPYTPNLTSFPWVGDGRCVRYQGLPVFSLRKAGPDYDAPSSLVGDFCVAAKQVWVPPYGLMRVKTNKSEVASAMKLSRQVLEDVWMLAELLPRDDSLPDVASRWTAQAVARMVLAARLGGSLEDLVAAAAPTYPALRDGQLLMRLAMDLSTVMDGSPAALMFLLGLSWLESDDGTRLETLVHEPKWEMSDGS